MADGHEIARTTRASHSRFVHRIKLLDSDGKEINPQSGVPYSPRQTCGHCHKYETVSGGTHTQMFPPAALDTASPPAHVWTVFDPATGIQLPLSDGFLAPVAGKADAGGAAGKPRNRMTAFDVAFQFGAFHPGGGKLELDTEGKRYDSQLAQNPGLRADPASAYFRSRWDQSGAMEVDCLLCHALSPYDHAERATQISVMNFRWAPTVGAGFGVASGKTTQLPLPSAGAPPSAEQKPAIAVRYNPAIFDPDGRVEIAIGLPPDRNCLSCHRKRSTEEDAWQDSTDADVHSTSGLRCVECHPGGIDHVLATAATAAENSSLTCQGCHASGRLGAPSPLHRGLPALHLDKIGCEACHSGPEPRIVPARFEQPTDPLWSAILASPKTSKPIGPTVWAPVFARNKVGKLQPFVRMLPQGFAQRTDAGLEPLPPQGIVPIFFRTARKEIKDDDGNGVPEINTEAEIAAMLKALKGKGTNAVYLADGKAFELSERQELTSRSEPMAGPMDRPVAHNVRPARLSLGANGCTDCHRSSAPFFLSIAPEKGIGEDGRPEGEPLYARCGKSRLDLQLGAWREQCLRPWAPWVAILFVLAVALHYVLFGPKRYVESAPVEEIRRFGVIERVAHFTLLVSFLALAVTGFALAVGVNDALGMDGARLHRVVSLVFIAAAAVALLVWVRDMLLVRKDLTWFRCLGGYLGFGHDAPAGRFNAGQKAFFWFICAAMVVMAGTGYVMAYRRPEGMVTVAYMAHDLCAYGLVLAIVAHIYLGTLANPGTLRSIFEGKVSKAWLRYHHPDQRVDDEKKS